MNNFNNNTNPFLEEDEDDFLESMVTNNSSEKVEYEERVETPVEWRARMIRETGDNGYLQRTPRPSDMKTIRVQKGGVAPVLNASPAQPVVQKPVAPAQPVSAPVGKPVEKPVVAQPAPAQYVAPVAHRPAVENPGEPQRKKFTRKVSRDPNWVGLAEAAEKTYYPISSLRRLVIFLDEYHTTLVRLGEMEKEDRFLVRKRGNRRLISPSQFDILIETELESTAAEREEDLKAAKERLAKKIAGQK